ncbi:DUF6233 domain-containing protein [Streptomyces luteogriseus]|uniref:DUF6233 domain-containing protein n=1 Tax=Streptomyces luteogriseus TaxID=68233 RepID=UPI00380A14B8
MQRTDLVVAPAVPARPKDVCQAGRQRGVLVVSRLSHHAIPPQSGRRPAWWQPDWLIEQGLNRDAPPVYVHIGGCHMAGKRSKGAPRGAAMRALTEGVAACPHCRPDSELGFLDG